MKRNNDRKIINGENSANFLPQKLVTNSVDDYDPIEDEKNRDEYFEINSKRMKQLSKKHHEEESRNKLKIEMKQFSNKLNTYQYTNDHNGGLIFFKKPNIEHFPQLNSLSHFHIDNGNFADIVQKKLNIKHLNLQKDETQPSLSQYLKSNSLIEKIEVENTLHNDNNLFKLSDGVSLFGNSLNLNKGNYFHNKTNLKV